MKKKVYDLIYNIKVREGVWYTEYYTVRKNNLDLNKLTRLIADEYETSINNVELQKLELRETIGIEKITEL